MFCKDNKRLEKGKFEAKINFKCWWPPGTLKESRRVAPVQNNISAFDSHSHFKSMLNQDMIIDLIF